MEYFAICGITVNSYGEDYINYASSLHYTVSSHYLNELKLIFKFTSSYWVLRGRNFELETAFKSVLVYTPQTPGQRSDSAACVGDQFNS